MLTKLYIKNYALIQDSEFTPKNGLNTLTGETGAGKSILLGALGLVTGKRADTSVLLQKDNKCVVEATFNLKQEFFQPLFQEHDLDFEAETIIRREISNSGKSRAFVNDTPLNLDTLKKIGIHLIDIHSQNETIKLNSVAYQTDILDLLTDSKPFLKVYQEQYKTVQHLKKELEETIKNAQQHKSELDYNLFLLNELNEVRLEEIDVPALENEVKLIENFTEVKGLLSGLNGLLEEGEYNITDLLGEASILTRDLSKLSPEHEKFNARLLSIINELQDLSNEISNSNDYLEIDENEVKEKINVYSKTQNLLQKHGVNTSEELLQIKNDLEQSTQKASNLDNHLLELKENIEKQESILLKKGDKLHRNRFKEVPFFNKQISSLCKDLGMPDAVFEIKHLPLEKPNLFGLNHIQFMFTANKGRQSEELGKVASGGEFSRLMFSLKYLLAEKTNLPTILFDEIDTGISGEIALKMGTLMQKMSKTHQLICITHLPQIASKGASQFFVYKNNTGPITTSHIRLLEPEERLNKIAEMIAGENPNQSAIESAKELLNH